MLYPTGNSGQNGQSISVFLESVDAEGFARKKEVKAKFSILMKNQISGKDRMWTGTFSCSFFSMNNMISRSLISCICWQMFDLREKVKRSGCLHITTMLC